MRAYKWLFFVPVLIIFQHIESKSQRTPVRKAFRQYTPRPSLSKPVPSPKLSKNPEERRRLGQDYVERYQDMMKASHESFEEFDKGLKRLIGDDDLGLMAEAGGVEGRRGRSGRLSEQSVVGRRRARSQVLRRDKLNAQSIISHKRHSRTSYN